MSRSTSPRSRSARTAREVRARAVQAEAAVERLRGRAQALEHRLREVNPFWLIAGGTVAGALAMRFVAPSARTSMARAGLLSAGVTALMPVGLAALQRWVSEGQGGYAPEGDERASGADGGTGQAKGASDDAA